MRRQTGNDGSGLFRWMKRAGLCVVAVSALTVFAAVPALATEQYGFTSRFGSEGAGDGEFKELDGVAINDETSDVYVVDKGNNRVEWFSADGSFGGQFNGSGTFANEKGEKAPVALAAPEAIAVDNEASSPSYGDVYVVDSSQGVIDKFSATGEYLGQLTKTDICERADELPPCAGSKLVPAPFTAEDLGGVIVDGEGHLWVEKRDTMYFTEFSTTGRYEKTVVDQYERGTESGFAIDSEGYLYATYGGNRVYKVSQTGEEVGFFHTGPPTALAIAPGTDDLLVDEGDQIAETGPFGASGETAAHFALGYLTSSDGIAVNTSGVLYATDSAGSDVSIFTPGVGEPPLVSEEKSTLAGQAASAVQLEANVNPNEFRVKKCKFEYGAEPSLATSTTVTCEPEKFGGNVGVHVQNVASGLAPGQTYYYRVTAINENESEVEKEGKGAIESFRMPDVPVLSVAAAQGINQTTAVLAGEVNPDGAETTYHFAYIDQAGYDKALAGDAEEKANPYAEGEITPVLKLTEGGVPDTSDLPQILPPTPISGLQPGRTYHYALIAYNIMGTTVTHPDQTFTTPVGTPPLVNTTGATGVSQNSATLSGTVATNGLQTNYGFEIGTEPGDYGPATGLGSIGGSQTEEVEVTLGELQPGTTYYYRVTATNADGTVQGAAQSFTTPGFPTLLTTPSSPPLIATPSIAFPTEEKGTTTTTPKSLTRAQKLGKALKTCRKKAKGKRASCERAARNSYGVSKKGKKK